MQPARKLGEIFLRREPESVSSARAMVRDLLGVQHPAYEQVRLAVSEITTNAVEHSTPGPVGDLVMVALKVVNDFIYVEVTDPGSASSKPQLRDGPSPDAEDGRGLFIVDELSSGNWGVRDFGAVGRTVWCAIPAEPATPVEEAAIITVRPE
ncbi:ATP-binding protein [Streptosporangium sp. NBC_01469]|uniref:ATP-binding protein n=1 Tax=Streptosporangium sp. NBC_01469 TaxID=2903898 RepID=UPI002E2C969D|nr:ATP-binding protein [Streptosporangium sp. NBC_01469]